MPIAITGRTRDRARARTAARPAIVQGSAASAGEEGFEGVGDGEGGDEEREAVEGGGDRGEDDGREATPADALDRLGATHAVRECDRGEGEGLRAELETRRRCADDDRRGDD